MERPVLDPDQRRGRSGTDPSGPRVFVLQVLLAGLAIVGIISWLSSLIHHIVSGTVLPTNSLVVNTGFVVMVGLLWWLARRGWAAIGAYSLLALVWLAATSLLLGWSFELPAAELTYCLSIVMAGILINARAGIITASLTLLTLAVTAAAQIQGSLHSNMAWIHHLLEPGDAIGYGAILGVIGLISWLSNREIDRSFRLAVVSEAALKDERDNLEIKVTERTRQLEQTQLERTLELQRFAEFGRLTSGLLHDLAGPLTTASLSLEQLSAEQRSQLVGEAQRSIRHLERYVDAAKRQLQTQSRPRLFSINAELIQAKNMLAHRAKVAGVTIELPPGPGLRLYGDPVKFSQIVANLLANAIDACIGQTVAQPITVQVSRQADVIHLAVIDHGGGISAAVMPHIFKPFYSLKRGSDQSTGLGLAIVKGIVEDDFGGSITVESSRGQGTRFEVMLPAGKAQRGKR